MFYIAVEGWLFCRVLSKSEPNVKQSHYRHGQALRVPEGSDFQISKHSTHESGWVVSTTHRPTLPLRKYFLYSHLLKADTTPGPYCGRKDYVNEKIPMTPSGIEPTAFRFVEQCLNHLRAPQNWNVSTNNINTLRTGDADLRFYVTTVQDGWRRFAFLTRW